MEKYHTNGVFIHPTIPSFQSTSKITYNGLLHQNGATEMYVHVGYGHNWEKIRDYKMTKTALGFEASIPIQHTDSLNICFKDANNNWDNNEGANYSFAITAPIVNADLEVADEISTWSNMKTHYHSNVSKFKTAIRRWLGSTS